MGLAPYGNAKYKNLILENLVDLKNDGTFRLNMEYFDYASGLKMTNEKFSKLFGKPARNPKTDRGRAQVLPGDRRAFIKI